MTLFTLNSAIFMSRINNAAILHRNHYKRTTAIYIKSTKTLKKRINAIRTNTANVISNHKTAV